MTADQGAWEMVTVTDADLSPHERERDHQIERALIRDGRPLSLLGVIARLDPKSMRWAVKLLHRIELLEHLDRLGREAEHASDRELCREYAAWVRGLPHGVCPEIFEWGGGDVQKATIERDRGRS